MFSLKNRRKEIDIIKFSYENLQYLNLSIHEALLSELKYLKSLYARTKISDYLLLAFLHIQSFLELGFCYEEHESISQAKQFSGTEHNRPLARLELTFTILPRPAIQNYATPVSTV